MRRGGCFGLGGARYGHVENDEEKNDERRQGRDIRESQNCTLHDNLSFCAYMSYRSLMSVRSKRAIQLNPPSA
jgi:hypothetical protein